MQEVRSSEDNDPLVHLIGTLRLRGGRIRGMLLTLEIDMQDIAFMCVAPDLKSKRRPSHTNILGSLFLYAESAVQECFDLIGIGDFSIGHDEITSPKINTGPAYV